MSPSLQTYSFIERFILASTLSPVTSVYGHPQVNRIATEESIKVLESKVKEKPKDWFFWFVLSDYYSAVGNYVQAIKAAEKCYLLRPKDPRSPYVLGSAIRLLTRARHLDTAAASEMQQLITDTGLGATDEFDPVKSKQALDELSLTIDEAAEKAMSFFEEAVALGLNESDSKMIKDFLASMYTTFPHLENKVKSNLKQPSPGLFAEVRGDPFNEATEHYRKIRYVMNDPNKLKLELVEIIRLCQLAIVKQRLDGDAHVLLANAYQTAALQTIKEGYRYFLPRAAAVIYEWKTRRLPTKNSEIGEQVYDGILNLLEQPFSDWMNMSLQDSIRDMHRQYYQEAISPNTVTEVRQILTNA